MKKPASTLASSYQSLHSLTGVESVEAHCVRPDRYRNLKALMIDDKPLIAQGAGLSYCLATASQMALSVDLRQFNRILEFNPLEHYIVVEAGMTIGDLILFLFKNGYWFSVLPGHPRISLGGCLAFNVHGKSQYHNGLFGDHVLSFNLLQPQVGEIEVVRGSELFDLSLGGMGLTGIVTKMKLKISKLSAKSILRKRISLSHLQEAPELFEKYKDLGDQMYSWHNLNLPQKKFGRGFLYLESFSEDEITAPFKMGDLDPNKKLNSFDRFLGPLMTYFIIPTYETLERFSADEKKFDLLNGAFPLNQKEIYFRACRAQKFYEYQCIVPHSNWSCFIEKFMALKMKWNIRCSLGSLKLFKGPQKFLHFQADGICFTADVLDSKKSLRFLTEVDELLIECNGLPNISKDSRLSAEVLQKTYSDYAEFKKGLQKFDSKHQMKSALRERIGV